MKLRIPIFLKILLNARKLFKKVVSILELTNFLAGIDSFQVVFLKRLHFPYSKNFSLSFKPIKEADFLTKASMA